jgi:DNA-binding CsgD family transcriptional regulator
MLFAAVAALAAIDLASDVGEGASATHFAVEAMILAAGLVGLATMLRRLSVLRREARALSIEADHLAARLEARSEEVVRWRREAREALAGLGTAIDRQLDRWGLTAAEKEVALLLLKGLSHKEIAAARSTSDATARQQARAVYRKGGLNGRSELAAFFLEDLLLPTEPAVREDEDPPPTVQTG